MKLTNISNFNTIIEFVSWKLNQFNKVDKTYANLFQGMFSEKDNVMAEVSDGYRIKKITYGECKEQIQRKAVSLKTLIDFPQNSVIGIYMDNSLDWIRVFWAVLMCGYRPLLLNLRLSEQVIENVLAEYGVKAVISDGKDFSITTIKSKSISMADSRLESAIWGDEVIFMSSGTTDKIKLCAYTAENFYYQLGNSLDIVNRCPQVSRHYNGELKLLTLLPFYHVFGFIAVYLWFGFFSRTFVFLKDLNPKTIQNTIKKHNVTHMFAVPLVWEAVYKATIRGIKSKGIKTYNKFCKGLKLSNSSEFGRKFTRRGMAEVRDNLFGESIQFLISGGGFISQNALEFFNGIGYHIANGYGMTEIGITSVDISKKAKDRNMGSIGAPFTHTQYKLDENGILLVKGKNMACKILQDGVLHETDYNEWFSTNDIAVKRDGRYFLCGRNDDLIIPPSGENINPQLIENELKITGADELCLISIDNEPILLIKSSRCYSETKLNELFKCARAELDRLKLQGIVTKAYVTPDKFLTDGEFKVNRRKIKERFIHNEFTLIDEVKAKETINVICGELENQIRKIFADCLSKSENDIKLDAHFFNELNGSSLEYFMLADAISATFGVDIKYANGKSLNTVLEICEFIKEN